MKITCLTSQKIRQQGFTLIELLLYVAIVGVLLTSVISYFGITVDARIKNDTITMVNNQGTAAMDQITQTIRNATSITAPVAGSSSNVSLTLVVPTGSLSPTVYDISASTLRVKEGAAAVIPLTSPDITVSNVTFKNVTKAGTVGAVQVSFTLNRVNTGSHNEYDYQQTFTSTAEIGW